MPDILADIRSWRGLPKELNERLVSEVENDRRLVAGIFDALDAGNDKEKGVCLEVLEAVTREHPDWFANRLPAVIKFIDHKAPRVKWESSRVVANMAPEFPQEAAEAIPKLVANTSDKGTVVRWSAAFALGEILKHNEKERKSLLARVDALLKKEQNNGVRNVYLKAMKALKK
jgi:HEAT repeat protein